MANLSFTELAKSDLKEIWVYTSEYSYEAADKLVDKLYEKFLLLAENPKMGKTHDEVILNLRSFPYKNYVVFYFPTDQGVEIFRVLHGARDIEQLFEDYFEGLKP